jgi:hypothetical protein
MSFLLQLKNIITIEPAIGLVRFGIGQIEGGQIQSDLLLWKICHLELNYTEEMCENLTLDEYDLINNEVQAKANILLMVKEWLVMVPALIWCLCAGKCGHKIKKKCDFSFVLFYL